MLKLIVFDWDGTLADSVGKIIECKKFLAEKYSLPAPCEETIRGVLGTQFESALATCFPDASQDILNTMGNEFHELMQQDDYQAKLFPYSFGLLNEFKKSGIKLAIATSKDKNEMDRAIIHNNLLGIFNPICCGKQYQEKPNPAMLKYIMQKFGITPGECIMIGDTTTDIQFAANAGIKTICVTFGAHCAEKLRPLNPLALIDDWRQLSGVISGLCYSYSKQM